MDMRKYRDKLRGLDKQLKSLIAICLVLLLLPVVINGAKQVFFLVVHPEIKVVQLTNPHSLSGSFAEEIGTASVKQKLVYKRGSRELLATFDDREAATRNVSSHASKTIDMLRAKFLFPFPLTTWNWKAFQWMSTTMLDREDKPDWYGESDEGYQMLRWYFDLIENDEQNDATIFKAKINGI